MNMFANIRHERKQKLLSAREVVAGAANEPMHVGVISKLSGFPETLEAAKCLRLKICATYQRSGRINCTNSESSIATTASLGTALLRRQKTTHQWHQVN